MRGRGNFKGSRGRGKGGAWFSKRGGGGWSGRQKKSKDNADDTTSSMNSTSTTTSKSYVFVPSNFSSHKKQEISEEESIDEVNRPSAYDQLLSLFSSNESKKRKLDEEEEEEEEVEDEDELDEEDEEEDKDLSADEDEDEDNEEVENDEEEEGNESEGEGIENDENGVDEESGENDGEEENVENEEEEEGDENDGGEVSEDNENEEEGEEQNREKEEEEDMDKNVGGFNQNYSEDELKESVETKKQLTPVIREEQELGIVFSTQYEEEMINSPNLNDYSMKKTVLNGYLSQHQKSPLLTPLQTNLFPIFDSYQDLLLNSEDHENHSELIELYTLHALNHISKTQSHTQRNTKILREMEKNHLSDIADRGFTRPRVLILVPFENTAMDIAIKIAQLSPHIRKPKNLQNIKDEHGWEPNWQEKDTSKRRKSPEFRYLFRMSVGDCFTIGVKISRDLIVFDSGLYDSDIIIASPLGLRIITGGHGDAERNYEFLSSIEITIVDQADAILMQNWENIEIIFSCLNLLPRQMKDELWFTRVRPYFLNGNGSYLRQTLMFSSIQSAEINSLFNKFCNNFRGRTRVKNISYSGTITKVISNVRQNFHRLHCATPSDVDDIRFDYFTKVVFGGLRRFSSPFTMIFIPSYFDFVRVRNFLKSSDKEFCYLSDHTTMSESNIARDQFEKAKAEIMLVTERWYYFKRFKLKGHKRLIFYGLPTFPEFYTDILNSISEENTSCLALYTRFEKFQLERIVGSNRATRMLESENNSHLFC